MDKVRVDKWLWSVRIFKSRTISTEACRQGRIKLNGASLKGSSLVKIGDIINVSKNGFVFQFEIKQLIEKRVGASIAVDCYQDLTPIEELRKYDHWFVGKSQTEIRERGTGRPTKRERREIDDYKNRIYDFDDE